jgi:hypothetical protein
MSYVLLDSLPTVQVFSPTLVSQGLLCTISSEPSGSILLRTVPQASFQADQGAALLTSLSDAVEQILQAGVATAAGGVQGLDASSLLYDAVLFTVTYVPPSAVPGEITGSVEIPVTIITLDVSFGSFVQGGNAASIIDAEYQRLLALAAG